MPKEYGRSQRVSSEMQKELAFILQREIGDSRLGFITINEVVTSKDLGDGESVFHCPERKRNRKEGSC